MEKPKLFSTPKEFTYFTLFLFLLLLLHLGFKYFSYQKFINKPFYYTYASVLASHTKHKENRSYQVLKLHSEEGFTFYTTTHRKEKFTHKRLRLQIFPSAMISFGDYLGSFYVKSKIKKQEPLPLRYKDKLIEDVNRQHKDKGLQQFYNAIFFATPIEKKLREKISLLGVSHLVALSGFHLSILWGLIYGLLHLLYNPLQQRYFPYRYVLIDVGVVAMSLLAMYVWFVDAPASLVRSFAMVFVGWAVLLMGMELLSFGFLAMVLSLLLVLFPSLLVSLSFWLSVTGVFYIFLLLHYFKTLNKWTITLLVIPVGIFLLMLPVVHGVFGMTSMYQLLSPVLSLLFAPFYPLVMLLHLVNMGNLFDPALLWLFNLPIQGIEMLLTWWVVLGYSLLSLGAVWSRKLFYVVLGFSFGYGVYIFAHTI